MKPSNKEIKQLVSVIIPVYNRIDYISETINSVLNQTYKNFELIVVDDGSTDGSFEYLEGLAKNNILKLYHHPNRENKGQSAALNIGLKHAQGEFIAILDSDDLFEKDKLEHQVAFLSQNPEIGIVYGMGTAIDGKGDFLYDIGKEADIELSDPNNVLLDCYFLLPQNSLVRRSCYALAGTFNESYRAAQDHDMLIRLCEVTKFAFLPRKVFKYRRHGASISMNGQLTRWSNGFKILEAAVNRYDYRPSTIRKRRAVLHFRLGLAKLKLNGFNKVNGVWHLLLSASFDPIRALKVVLGYDKSSFGS